MTNQQVHAEQVLQDILSQIPNANTIKIYPNNTKGSLDIQTIVFTNKPKNSTIETSNPKAALRILIKPEYNNTVIQIQVVDVYTKATFDFPHGLGEQNRKIIKASIRNYIDTLIKGVTGLAPAYRIDKEQVDFLATVFDKLVRGSGKSLYYKSTNTNKTNSTIML